MKKIILMMAATLLMSGSGLCKETTKTTPKNQTKQEVVYICTGGYATKYHKKKNCRGLYNCKGKVVEISKTEAVKKGRTACKLCH